MFRNWVFASASGMSLAMALSLSAGGAAFAQSADTAAPAASTDLGEVVVVARRSDERLQSVPLAVTALSASTLQNNTIQSGLDLEKLVPTLSIEANNLGAGPVYSLRGIRDGVQSYFNEVPAGTSGVDLQLWDLSSIQAVPGPQGTLFGRNSTGGAILFVPQRPTKSFDGYVDGQYGNYNYYQGTGVVNVPVNDMLQMRLGVQITKRDGVVKNDLGPDLQSQNRQAYRASFLFTPTSKITDYLVVDYSNRDETNYALIAENLQAAPCPVGFLSCLYPNVAALGAQQVAFGVRHVSYNYPEYDKDKPLGVSNILTGDLGGVTLKYILGYRTVDFSQGHNTNSLNLPLAYGISRDTGYQWTHELQASGKAFDSRLSWIVGAFYLENKETDRLWFNLLLFPATLQPNMPLAQESGSIADNKSAAVYGQGTFDLTDKLKFTAGIRYTQDRPEQLAESFLPGPTCAILALSGTNPATCQRPLSATFTATTYNIDLDYQLSSNTLVYAATRRGYNQGGFNGSFNDPTLVPILPEYITDYEVGAKADFHLAGIPIRTNAAVYYAKYTNIQRGGQKIVDGFTFSGTFNAAAATIYGAQLEVTARPTDHLTLSGSYAYLHSKYDSFNNTLLGDATGNAFAQAPEDTAHIGATYRYPLSKGEIVGNINYAYTSTVTFTDVNLGSDNAFQKPYGLLDARIDWKNIAGKPVDIGFWVKNLTDTIYAVNILDQTSTFGFTSNSYGDPRTFGVELRYRFGASAQ
jgi:iron complex outermembrane receptor protein